MSGTTVDPTQSSADLQNAIQRSAATVPGLVNSASTSIDQAMPAVQQLNQSLADTIGKQGAIQTQAYSTANDATSKLAVASQFGKFAPIIGLFDSDYSPAVQKGRIQTAQLQIQNSQNQIANAKDATQAGIAVATLPTQTALQKLSATSAGIGAQTTAASGVSTAQRTGQEAIQNATTNASEAQLATALAGNDPTITPGMAQVALNQRKMAAVELQGQSQQVGQNAKMIAVANASPDQLKNWVDNPATLPAGMSPGLVADENTRRQSEPLNLEALGQSVKAGSVDLTNKLKTQFLSTASAGTLNDLVAQAQKTTKPGVDGYTTVQTPQGPVTFTAQELNTAGFQRAQGMLEMQKKVTEQQQSVASTMAKAGYGDNLVAGIAKVNGGVMPPDLGAKMAGYTAALQVSQANGDALSTAKTIDERNKEAQDYIDSSAKAMDPELQGAYRQVVSTGTLDSDAAAKGAFHLLRNPAALQGGVMESIGPGLTASIRQASTEMGLMLGQGSGQSDTDILAQLGGQKNSQAIIDRALTKSPFTSTQDGKVTSLDYKTKLASVVAGEYFKNAINALAVDPATGKSNGSFFSKYVTFDPVSGKSTGNLSQHAYIPDGKGGVTFSMNSLVANMASDAAVQKAQGVLPMGAPNPTDTLMAYLGNRGNMSQFRDKLHSGYSLPEESISKLLMNGQEQNFIGPQLQGLNSSALQGTMFGVQQAKKHTQGVATANMILQGLAKKPQAASSQTTQDIINTLTSQDQQSVPLSNSIHDGAIAVHNALTPDMASVHFLGTPVPQYGNDGHVVAPNPFDPQTVQQPPLSKGKLILRGVW